MTRKRNIILTLIVVLFVTVLCIPSGFADDKSSHGLIRKQSTTIPHGAVVEDLLVLGHDVNVLGSVSEILVVVDGNVHVGPASHTGIIVDLGGAVVQDSGSTVEGVYRLSLHNPFWGGTLFGITVMMLVWVVMLAIVIAFIIIAVLMSGIFGKHWETSLALMRKSVRRIGIIGLMASIVTGAVCVFLALTDIGLPFAGLLFLAYSALGIVGLSIVSTWLGELVFTKTTESRPIWLQTLIGAGILGSLMFIPIVGELLFLVFWFVGVGAVAAWLYRVRNQKRI